MANGSREEMNMAENIQVNGTSVRSLKDVLREVENAIQSERTADPSTTTIKDLRWKFDQVSAKMNQAIYNDQHDQVHDSALKTVAVLIEILARS